MIHRFITWLLTPVLDWFDARILQDGEHTRTKLARLDASIEMLSGQIKEPADYGQEFVAVRSDIVGIRRDVALQIDNVLRESANVAKVIGRDITAQTGVVCEHINKAKVAPIDHTGEFNGVASAINAVRDSLVEIIQQPPALSIGALMLWDAVSFAADKYDRDTGLHGVSDRYKEIRVWVHAYLNENQWPVPSEEVLRTFIALREQVDNARRVSKY